MALFRNEPEGHTRAFLVEVIWQYRQAASVSFLAEALQDRSPEVWKQALDGLVTLASTNALEALRAARFKRQDSEDLCRWLDEAIEQVQAGNQKG